MLMDDVAQCAGPGCSRPLNRRATGRPARYCGPNCRKVAQRERERRAGAVQRELDAHVIAGVARLQLEEDVDGVGKLAAAVVAYAAGEDGEGRQDLVSVLARFRARARDVEAHALAYFDAIARVEQIQDEDTYDAIPAATWPSMLEAIQRSVTETFRNRGGEAVTKVHPTTTGTASELRLCNRREPCAVLGKTSYRAH